LGFPLIARCLVLSGLFLGIVLASPVRAELRVVASIKPVHSLVSAVMAGTGQPVLIVEGSGSPHHYALKPSTARQLEQADVIFWVGHDLETFLEKPVETVGARARPVALGMLADLERLEIREGVNFERHKEDGHEIGHEPTTDPHVWLDPQNAAVMVRAIASVLSESDPANAGKYEANAAETQRRLIALGRELEEAIRPLRDRHFIVFHDAYQYFEHRFGLQASGSIAIDPEIGIGARRLQQIRQAIEELGVGCVFTEPQFDPGLVQIATEGMDVRTEMLDPLGSGLARGPDQYFELLRGMGQAFSACLAGGDMSGG
jgi:zinc transport system substrate-binding protein